MAIAVTATMIALTHLPGLGTLGTSSTPSFIRVLRSAHDHGVPPVKGQIFAPLSIGNAWPSGLPCELGVVLLTAMPWGRTSDDLPTCSIWPPESDGAADDLSQRRSRRNALR